MKRFSQTVRDYVTMVCMAAAICASCYAYSYAFGAMPGPQGGGGSGGVSLSGTNTWTGAQTVGTTGGNPNVIPFVVQAATGQSAHTFSVKEASIGAEILFVNNTEVGVYGNFRADGGIGVFSTLRVGGNSDATIFKQSSGFVGVGDLGLYVTPITSTQRDVITPTEGMMIYNSTLHKMQVRTASAWETITSL